METFSALLALCAGSSPVTAEFPAQKPMTRSFDVFFDLRLNKRPSKQSWGWWFETSWRSLWHHCNVYMFTPNSSCSNGRKRICYTSNKPLLLLSVSYCGHNIKRPRSWWFGTATFTSDTFFFLFFFVVVFWGFFSLYLFLFYTNVPVCLFVVIYLRVVWFSVIASRELTRE